MITSLTRFLRWPATAAFFMGWIVSLSMAGPTSGLVADQIVPDLASTTNATGGGSISADTARNGGSGAYTALTGPVITETNDAGMPVGTMILKVPSGFEFATNANSVNVKITGSGAGVDAVLASTNATPTVTNITVTITTASTSTRRTTFTWNGIKVRPINGTPLTNGNITYSGTSTGVVAGANMGTLAEVVGAAAKVRVETAVDGSGTVVPAQDIVAGGSLTVYSISRDAFTNFITNVVADVGGWTLTNRTGGVTSGDLAAAGDRKSATFSANLVGSANIHAAAGALAPTDSGTITVTLGAASRLTIATPPSATATVGVVFAQQPVIRIEDASGNLRTNDTLVVTAARSGGAGTLHGTTNIAAVGGIATFTDLSHLVASSITIQFSSGALTPATSGTVVVKAGAFSKLQLLVPGETAAPGTPAGKTGTPVSETVGVAFNATINAVDTNWNLINTVTDMIHIASSDPIAVLPPDAALAGGTQTFSVTLKTVDTNMVVGTNTVTATDLTDGSKTPSTSPPITVRPPVVQEFYVPEPEAQVHQAFDAMSRFTKLRTNMMSVISIVVTAPGTVIYYDQWEDGYEDNINSSSNSTTQIWGDGNDADGIPPGFAHNPLGIPAGMVITLTNVVSLTNVVISPAGGPYGLPGRNLSGLLYDGGDRIAATKAITISRAAWDTFRGPEQASAVEVQSTIDHGLSYIAPIGTNVVAGADGVLFSSVGIFVMADQDNTTVVWDPDGTGTTTYTNTIARGYGGSFLIPGGISVGATVKADKPIQVDMLTGDATATYEARSFALRPAGSWSSQYVIPVGTMPDGNEADAWLFNTNTAPLVVQYTTYTNNGTLTVPGGPRGLLKCPLPQNSGTLLQSTNETPFFVVVAMNCSSNASFNDDSAFDWGFTPIPFQGLTTEAVCGWGPGNANVPASSTNDNSPVFVTPLSATRIYVEYHGQGTNIDPNGGTYDVAFDLGALQSQMVFSPDNDQTGMRLYTLDGTLIAAAWGEESYPNRAYAPFLDMGTALVPFPTPSFIKTSTLLVDNPPAGLSVGDVLLYTLKVSNKGLLPLGNLVVYDPLPSQLSYVTNTTTLEGNPLADNQSGNPFPLTAPGYTIPVIQRGGASTFTFECNVVGTGRIVNAGFAGDLTSTNIVLVLNPGIAVKKTVSLDGSVPGLSSVEATNGAAVTFGVIVQNTGNAALTNVVVNDPQIGYTTNIAELDVGQSFTGVVAWTSAGTLTNVVTATGYDPAGSGWTGSGTAVVQRINPGIHVQKTVSLTGAVPGLAQVQATNGAAATFGVIVSNTGDVALTNVVVSDPQIGGFATNIATLGVGQSVTGIVVWTVSGTLTNVATAIGYDPNGAGWMDVGRASVRLINPGIAVQKTASGGAGVYPGSELVHGTNLAPVKYWFVVSNTGDVALTSVTLTDTDIVPTLSTNLGALAAGQSATVGVASAITADLVNTGRVTGLDVNGTAWSASDTAAVDLIHPAIALQKTASGGAGAYPGSELVHGTNQAPVTYWFVVSNTGDVSLASVTLTDTDIVPTLSTNLGTLAAGQSATVSVASAITVDLVNTGRVSGLDVNGTAWTASDTAAVDLIHPAIALQKTASGGAGAYPGSELVHGTNQAPVTYWFVVSNTGDVSLASVTLTDTDIVPTLSTNLGTLAAGQSATVSVASAITVDLVNTGRVSGLDVNGTAWTASDTAAVDLIHPAIALQKTASGGAGAYPGSELVHGTNQAPVKYWFVVSNTGDVALTSVTLTDNDIIPTLSTNLGALAAGQSATVGVASAITADLVNTGRVSGLDVNGTAWLASDTAAVDLISPGLALDKTVSLDGSVPGVGQVWGTNGAALTYSFVVTNAGDVTLTNVMVVDTVIGYTNVIGALPVGGAATVSVGRTLLASVTNLAVASGRDPNGALWTANDTAIATLINPSIAVQKTVSLTGAVPGVPQVQATNGAAATFGVIVSNTGDVALTNVVVSDPQIGGFATNIATLGVGQSVTGVVVWTVSGTLTNVATATGYDVNGAPWTGNGTASVRLINPGIHVQKTVSLNGAVPGLAQVQATNGAAATFGVIVSNTGDVALTNVVVSDPQIGGFATNIATLGVGQSVTGIVVWTVSGTLTNVATATGYDVNGAPWTGNGTASVRLINPGIHVQKTVSLTGAVPGLAQVQATNGAAATFGVIVSNTGDVALTNVVVSDPQIGGFATNIATLGVGQSVTGVVVWTVSGTLTNVATATGYDVNGAPWTGNGTAIVYRVSPSIQVIKTADNAAHGTIDYVRPGANVVYTYKVINTGDTYLSAITATDNVLGVVGTIAGPVAPGATNILYATNSTVTADVTNVVVVSGNPTDSSGADLPTLMNVTATDSAVVQLAYLAVAKEDTPDPVQAGAALSYTLWIANPSPHDVTGVVVTEQYPPNFTFVTATPLPTTGNNTWSLGTLAPGQLAPIVIDGIASSSAARGSILANKITVVSGNAGTNTTSTTTVVTKPAAGQTDLRVIKADSMDPVRPGDVLAYTVRVENLGPVTATNVVLTETYDPMFTFTGSAPAPDSGTSNTWHLGDLAANDYRDISITGQVSGALSDGSLLTNLVVATATNALPSRDSEVTLVGTEPPPNVVKTHSQAPVLAGHTLIYTVTVDNASSATVVSNVTLIECYDPNFIFVSATPAPMAGTSNLWHLGDLPPLYTTNVVIVGKVSTNILATDTLFNTVTVVSDSGSRSANDTTPVLQPATVGGLMWEDTNGNSLYDVTEVPGHTVGQPVSLYATNGTLVATTNLGANGRYVFSGLWPTNYYLQFASPTNHVFVTANVGTNDNIDSDANTNSGLTATFSLSPGQSDQSWYAGVVELGSIGQYVWNDANGNKIFDLTEAGLNGVTVNLYRVTGNVTNFVSSTVTTNSGGRAGHYLFTGLAFGSYYVTLGGGVPPNLTTPTTPMSFTVTVGYATVYLNANFGIRAPPTPVTLKYFRATAAGGEVLLEWETGVEIENLGFNLYRSDGATGAKVQLNAGLIAGKGTAVGQYYSSLDGTADPALTYYYWLEDVSWDFQTQMHGPAICWGSEDPSQQACMFGTFSTVTTGGLYRISYETLAAAGLPVESMDPATVSIRVDGQEAPAYVSAAGTVLQPGDFVLFYASESTNGLACEVGMRPQAARMNEMFARPSRAPGDVFVGQAGTDQRLSFTTDAGYARYMLVDFAGTPVWVLDVTEATNSAILYGYSYVSGTNGLTAVYMSYSPDVGQASCIAVQDAAVMDVHQISKR